MAKKFMSIDGNTAASYISYAFTEVAGIYPITPSSTMAEVVDAWAAEGKKNVFNDVVELIEMQSEAGAAAVVHGALKAGTLSTTYTASQGLLLMIPNIYKWVGELLPGVVHVAARSLATRSLSIFGDHQDVYAVRQTGAVMLSSHSVQEVMDLAGVAHLAAIEASVPVIHFFDGFRTSHEIQKIEMMDYDFLKSQIDQDALNKFRARAVNPHGTPKTAGGAENDDIYFQGREAQNKHFEAVSGVIEKYMAAVSKQTGRHYAPFTYYGDEEATTVIVAMGSVTETIIETVDALRKQGEKVGLVKVHLYRPFIADALIRVLPKTVKKIAVLDRTKETGALGEPLYLDVVAALKDHNVETIIGGRYGLSSKDTRPNQIKAVYDHVNQEKPFHGFTIGINDDVTFLSLPVDNEFVIQGNYTGCLFYGLGSDGTVSANKNAIKIIGDNTDLYTQAYFAYDSKKAGGATRSHLRFGHSPIKSTYYVGEADFISCSLDSYIFTYDMLKNLKKGGTFLLNTMFSLEDIEAQLPNKVKKQLAQKEAKFYIIDASAIAEEIGMGRRTNTILQSSFFALNPAIMNYEDAVKYMKDAALKSYGKKGQDIVDLNYLAIDKGREGLVEVAVKSEWANLTVNAKAPKTGRAYVDEFVDLINTLEGYDIPVSTFEKLDILDGTMEQNISYNEKRTIAKQVPRWIPENCIQCNKCSFVCPHATIRPFLLTEDEIAEAPTDVETIQAVGKGVEDLQFRIMVSPDNCVGCSLCAVECPGKAGQKALEMVEVKEELHNAPLADYLYKEVEYKTNFYPVHTVKGSQFSMPYFEVSGACAGCGETPYYKLITQLFGSDMMIANATGCTSIYSGSTPSTPFVTDKNGHGPSWANSLFEDNAEFGFGMHHAQKFKQKHIFKILSDNLNNVEPELKTVIEALMAVVGNRVEEKALKGQLVDLIKASKCEAVKEVLEFEMDIVSKSQWIIGGDGWAYDIGYGGLDHVLANNDNVNILVLDTEVYSNTGGQSSKSSQAGSIAKFAAGGKKTSKKDMGLIAMAYGHVYVASIAMGANPAQVLKALNEAESYDGPSIILAYSPCIEHGIKGGLMNHQETQRKAVKAGYWPLYRFDPRLGTEGQSPLQIDFKEPDFDLYKEFILSETRFGQLTSVNPEHAQELFEKAKTDAQSRFARLKRWL